MSYLSQTDFFLDVQRGLVPNHSAVLKFGNNPITSTGQEDIWTPGGTIIYPATAGTAVITSTDSRDNSVGSGARTLRVEGVDSDYEAITEDVTMNGTTGVTTTNAFLRICRMRVLAVGNLEINLGKITASITTVQAEILPVWGQTLMTHYTVPAGMTAYMLQYYFSIQKSTSIAVDFHLFTRPFENAWNLKSVIAGNSVGSSYGVRKFAIPLKIMEKTDIKITATGEETAGDVAGGFDLINVVN